MELKLISTTTPSQKIIYAIVAIFGLFLLFLVWVWPMYAFLTSYDLHPSIQFEPMKWKNKSMKESGHPIRIQMVENLIESRILDGMSKAETLNLLGEADSPGYFEDWDLVYWLGPERGPIGINSEWLVIRFNNDQEVSEYKVVED